MNSNKQWIRDPEHPTQWILNPNFRPSTMQIQPIEEPIVQLPVEPPSMQILPIEEPVIQLPVKLPQVEPPSMQILPIEEPVIQLPVKLPQVEPPSMQIQPIPDPIQIQPIVEPIQLPGVVVDSREPTTPVFHPGFLCLGPENCPHFSHQTQMPPRASPSNNIILLPVSIN